MSIFVKGRRATRGSRPPQAGQRPKQAAEKPVQPVILSPFAVILSAAKNLALPAQGKLREGYRSKYFQGNARFFLRKAQDRLLAPLQKFDA
jgi:hypothetical protein